MIFSVYFFVCLFAKQHSNIVTVGPAGGHDSERCLYVCEKAKGGDGFFQVGKTGTTVIVSTTKIKLKIKQNKKGTV